MSKRLFIFIGGSDAQNGDYSRVHRLARSGGTANWSSLKDARPGDRVLIYIQRPHSALVAKAEVLDAAVKGKPGDYRYRAKTGRFKLLGNPLTIRDLKRLFPGWAWLRFPRGKEVVPPQYANRLWRLVHKVPAIKPAEQPNTVGGGFGDAKTNRLVEKAAVRKVKQLLKKRGFVVTSRERDQIGYDLDATKRGKELHVEVKGVSGNEMQFVITRGELSLAGTDAAVRLMVVTHARGRNARVHEFLGKDVSRLFGLTPVSYFAKMK
jgi:hypothetical protein